MDNKKIVLCAVNAKYVHTNLAVRSIKSYCEAKGCNAQIEIYETTINDSMYDALSDLYGMQGDVYGFSCYLWNIDYVKSLAENLKKAFCGEKEICIYFGGPEVSYTSREVLEENLYVDYVMCGEGEVPSYELFSSFNPELVPSLTYRRGDEIIKNPTADFVDLNEIPFVYNEDIDTLNGKMLYYETSRGCPFSCTYCLSGSDNRVRYLSLDRVKEDFMFFITHGVPLVKLVDRTFNASKSRTKEIIKFICDNSVNTKFHMEIAGDILDEELLSLLKNAPKDVMQFEIGVQTTNPQTLKAINRYTDMEKLKSNVSKLLEYENIHIHLDLIAGLPYENLESFKKSFNEVISLSPHVLQLGFLKVLKGSYISNQSEQFNYRFETKAPYEVLGNSFISFGELTELKRVEKVLDKLYNSNSFENTLTCLFKMYNMNYYQAFKSIADYFDENGYFNVSLSKYSLYDVLYEYKGRENNELKDCILYDYLKNITSHSLPRWAESHTKEFSDRCYSILKDEALKAKIMPHYENVPAKKIIKTVVFQKFTNKVCMFDRKTNTVFDLTEYFI